MEGLEKLKQQVLDKEGTRSVLNKLRVSVNQHCDRISNDVSSVSNEIIEVQEGINTNTSVINKEVDAFKQAAAEENRMVDQDQMLKENFEKKLEFIEKCKVEIEQIKKSNEQCEKHLTDKKILEEKELMDIVDVTKTFADITGVVWDYDNIGGSLLKGYVVSKIHNRVMPFEFNHKEQSRDEITEKLWSIVEEVNSH